ncbi:hypothetical protein CRG98_039276 [Punica granatum]|uniref:Uncharacterized protein n=1 Tax=Punica granatum TaxID=22663 RepID=A0A2I0I959_PUNGR|nr:hypothetical protein CRG98_039276 [Punica granatum]
MAPVSPPPARERTVSPAPLRACGVLIPSLLRMFGKLIRTHFHHKGEVSLERTHLYKILHESTRPGHTVRVAVLRGSGSLPSQQNSDRMS